MNFSISVRGFYDIRLSPGKRDMVKVGDVMGVFSCLSSENPIIGYDRYTWKTIPPTLLASSRGVSTPLTFYEDPICRHYSMGARFVGKYDALQHTCSIHVHFSETENSEHI